MRGVMQFGVSDYCSWVSCSPESCLGLPILHTKVNHPRTEDLQGLFCDLHLALRLLQNQPTKQRLLILILKHTSVQFAARHTITPTKTPLGARFRFLLPDTRIGPST
ncbi:hypothetical protein HZ326_26340 [Fusarium oxysporum f. sp. albedinis]|nr:Ubiquitin thiolesterase [Fusarium oxysporum f. sp. albedinis]KAJ0130561.1 hypothetical protein HZ326_26340 [Fusarium oxysporum f. sp. albedinis]